MSALDETVLPPRERRAAPWGRRTSGEGWPPGGAAPGCRIIDFERTEDPRGNLTFVEADHCYDEFRAARGAGGPRP